jgi:DNA polymerase-1
VLFVDLAIPTEGVKKNKTGYSTASPELEKLRAEYPIVKLIEEYRETFKLKTTYVDVLPGLVKSDGRLHTTYRQDIAATGRLSSVDPNLQNIPIRTALGARIRDGFIAPVGKKLVGADYSQIELRIAAHLSGDANMTRAFLEGEDIHRATAALVHDLKPDEVSDSLRREAKALNFGIIYGMGAFGLAQATDMDQKKAAQFIKDYLRKFSGVAKYMDDMKKFAHEKGYVETALGRRRTLPEIQSTNQALVRGAERMAINMPIQGLAADIMKLAMLAAHRLIESKYANSARLLLQIHDELIAEVDEQDAVAFATDLKLAMESVYKLSVPLAVSVEIGNNWGEI